MQNVSNYEDVRGEITRYAREYIRWCRSRKGMSYAEIGRRLGVSHSWVKQLDGDEHDVKKIGPDVELALASLLHGGSIDGLRVAAHILATGDFIHVQDRVSGEAVELPVQDSETMPTAKRLRSK